MPPTMRFREGEQDASGEMLVPDRLPFVGDERPDRDDGKVQQQEEGHCEEGPADGEREIDCERYRLRRRATILDSVRLYSTADPHQVRDVYYEVRGDQYRASPAGDLEESVLERCAYRE